MDALLGGPPGTAGGYGPSGGAAQTLEGVTVQIVQNRDILGFWSDLLYALLEPVVYASSHVESTEGGSGECYSEFANCRSLSLLSVIGGAALTELREAIYSKTVRIPLLLSLISLCELCLVMTTMMMMMMSILTSTLCSLLFLFIYSSPSISFSFLPYHTIHYHHRYW